MDYLIVTKAIILGRAERACSEAWSEAQECGGETLDQGLVQPPQLPQPPSRRPSAARARALRSFRELRNPKGSFDGAASLASDMLELSILGPLVIARAILASGSAG